MTQPDTKTDEAATGTTAATFEDTLQDDALRDDARVRSSRALRDRALTVLLAGVFLLTSPLLNAVTAAGTLGGVPINLLYVFGIWFGLIFATSRLATRLENDSGDD